MNEGITISDILKVDETHSKTKATSNLGTILGFIGVGIVLVLLWNAYSNSRTQRDGIEKNTNVKIGELEAGQNGIASTVAQLQGYERADALKLAYNDGAFGAGFGGYNYGHGYNGGCHGHGDCTKSKFNKVENYTLADTTVALNTTCGC